MVFRITSAVAFFASMTLTIGFARAGPAADFLPPASFDDPGETISPVDNSAFRPGNDAEKAHGFAVRLIIEQTAMHTEPEITQPICDGAAVEQGGSCRGGDDKRLFPAISLEAFTVGDILSFAETGQMVKETGERPGGVSYWRVIPQDGRVWTEPGETRVRAAFPLMLVHDFENHAHQGLASFLIDADGNVSDLWIQFVQQTTPWNIPQHFTAAAVAQMTAEPSGIGNLDDTRHGVIAAVALRGRTRSGMLASWI